MSNASHSVTFQRECTSAQIIQTELDGDFCRQLVIDEDRSPDTQLTDPCPHLFLKFYTTSASEVEAFMSQGFVILYGKVIETVHEIINFTSLSGSLEFCNIGIVDYTWTPIGTDDCPESPDPIIVSGQNVTVPDFGTLDIYYQVAYYPVEVTLTIAGDFTVIVCQDGKASTYSSNAGNCVNTIPDTSNDCCYNERDELVLGNVAAVQGTEVVISCTGGCLPYMWQLINAPVGAELQTLAGEVGTPYIRTEGNACLLVISDEACGDGEIQVIDYCGARITSYIQGLPVCCEDLVFSPLGPSSFSTSGADSFALEVQDGKASYVWSILSGNDYTSLEYGETITPFNTAITTSSACGEAAQIMVTDACGHQCSFTITPTSPC